MSAGAVMAMPAFVGRLVTAASRRGCRAVTGIARPWLSVAQEVQ